MSRLDWTATGLNSLLINPARVLGPGGLGDTGGDGEFLQTIDTTVCCPREPTFLEVRAFRHRTDGGPAIFSDFKESVYVDRLPPESEVMSFEPYTDWYQ